jgi:uncharacterized protein (DUF58 family)
LATFRDAAAEVITAHSSTVHLHHLYRALANTQPSSSTDTEKGLAGLPERFPQRGLIVLISDLLDDTERIIAALKGFCYRRHEVIIFHLLAPEERDFPYRENMAAHTDKIRRFCRQNDIDFVPLTTAELLSTALIAYLSKRQRAT